MGDAEQAKLPPNVRPVSSEALHGDGAGAKDRAAVGDDYGNNASRESDSHRPGADDGGEYDDFEVITRVLWGPRREESDYDTDQELAPRPRQTPEEACQCLPQPGACSDYSCILFACHEECRGGCPAGEYCQNKRLQQRNFPKLEVIDCGPKGKGLRTLEHIKQGQFCAEYCGRAVKANKLKQLFRRYQLDRRLYIMALDEGVLLDARQQGSIARYINHSCNPNCKVERWTVRGIVRAAVVALQDIKPMEELTFDYKWERNRDRAPTKCHCGAANCRGTLELPKSLDETDLEEQLQDQWLRTRITDGSIVNRTVRIFSKENKEYFIGEITGFDAATQQHSILYRHDMSEVWEDLKKEDWMILDAKVDKSEFMIAKKQKRNRRASPTSSLVSKVDDVAPFKHFLYVQTPTYQALQARHIIEQCERNCVVQIHAQQFCKPTVPPARDNPYEQAKYKALEVSLDGSVWKLSISGSGVAAAFTILQKQAVYWDKRGEYNETANGVGAGTGNVLVGVKALSTTTSPHVTEQQNRHQIIFPREISDLVKQELPALRAKCRAVNLSIIPSESVSKQFGRLVLDGSLESDVATAKEILWNAMLVMCTESEVPSAPNKLPKNLGFFAGELSVDHFQLLFGSDIAMKKGNTARLRMEASEDLLGHCPFFVSFESTQRCTIWVQADYDKGRINSNNQVVSQGDVNSPRHVFIGGSPNDVPRLWNLLQTRVKELSRGVKYLHLGVDRIYQKLIMTNGSNFFDFVTRMAGVRIDIDPMTGDHIRIEGKLSVEGTSPDVLPKSECDRAALAEEIIKLQIELYRDHCTREHSWIFGRDWSLISSAVSPLTDPAVGSISSFGQLDIKSAAQGATEIAEITKMLDLEQNVAGHAATILYRFACVKESKKNIKVRDAVLASVFLANKCQKAQKWKRLDQVLKTGFEAMYKSKFDEKQDLKQLTEKIIATEAEILQLLGFDVFWRDMNGICSAVAGTGRVQPTIIQDILDFMFSGPVLGCGYELWLRYGPEYLFAVAAGFMSVDMNPLLSALRLIPLKVSRAAELLIEAVKSCRLPNKKTAKTHRLLDDNTLLLEERLAQLKESCIDAMSKASSAFRSDLQGAAVTSQRYKLIEQNSRQRFMIRGVSTEIMQNHCVAQLTRVSTESQTSAFVDRSCREGFEDIIIEGNWRAVYLADALLRQAIGTLSELPVLEILSQKSYQSSQIQAKSEPGRLKASELGYLSGWEDTILSTVAGQSMRGRTIGGKSCIAARIADTDIRESGLRWWLPQLVVTTRDGSLSDMFLVRSTGKIEVLGKLATLIETRSVAFPILSSLVSQDAVDSSISLNDFVALSIQQWPSDKMLAKEKAKQSKGKTERVSMGFSPTALQEMQLLTKLHGLIQVPSGHPNFLLPIGIAVGSDMANKNNEKTSATDDLLTGSMLSLFQLNEDAAKTPDVAEVRPHIVFHPTPFVLQRLLSKKYNRGSKDLRAYPNLMATWFHDILSALVHCHSNHVILRNVQLDQIMVDQAGVLKFGCLYRSAVSDPQDIAKSPSKYHSELLKAVKDKEKQAQRKKKNYNHEDETDENTNPYAAPEILLGCPRFSQESDVWTIGCVLAHLLLNKPVFQGKDRTTLFGSIVKVVGTPRENNFELLKKFPLYPQPSKKYKRDVNKALEHMLKEDSGNYGKAIDLIARMIHLDPTMRCTASEALGHEYMADFIEKSNSDGFRKQFVSDWMKVKASTFQQATVSETSHSKRKAMLMTSNADDDEDDDGLYDVEELMAEQTGKRPRI